MPKPHPGFLRCLDDSLVLRLATASPEVRHHVEHAVSRNAIARMLGLDGLSELAVRRDAPAATAPEALPFLFALARAPDFPHASAVLRRLAIIVDVLDAPPRSLASRVAREPDGSVRARTWAAFDAELSALLRIARTTRDPESARAAAHIVSRFPRADAELEPVLVAMLTGAPDEPSRARVAYALTRVQSARGNPLHARLERYLDAPGCALERVAVALALAHRHDGGALGRRSRTALEAHADAPYGAGAVEWPDPSRWADRDLRTAIAEVCSPPAATQG